MKNFISIDGKQIKLSEETAENIKRAFLPDSNSDDLIALIKDTDMDVLQVFKTRDIQIGGGAVELSYKNKCLVISKDLRAEILPNDSSHDWAVVEFPEIIVFHKR